jgi:hypothetical protein
MLLSARLAKAVELIVAKAAYRVIGIAERVDNAEVNGLHGVYLMEGGIRPTWLAYERKLLERRSRLLGWVGGGGWTQAVAWDRLHG